MDVAIGIVLALFAGLLILAWRYADRADAQRRLELSTAHPRTPGTGTGTGPGPGPSTLSGFGRGRPGAFVLAAPPVVQTDSGKTPLRDWLVHLHPDNRNVWSDVVREFIDAAGADPEVAAYFGDDHEAMQKHFLGVLITATEGGVTVRVLEQLRARHAAKRNDRGQPITTRAFDSATGVLIDILRSKQVPDATVQQVGLVLLWLREAIAGGG